MLQRVQWFLKKFGLVALISYTIEILVFLVLWKLMKYSLIEAAWWAWATSWPILPLIPIAMYIVTKKYRR